MKVFDALCCGLLAIMVTATCAHAGSLDSQETEELLEERPKKITKRETAVLIDNYPFEARYKQPNVIYMRRTRYPYSNKVKTKYARTRPKHSAAKPKRPSKRVPYKRVPHKSAKKYPTKSRYVSHKPKHVMDYKKKRPTKSPTYHSQEPTYHSQEPTYHSQEPTYHSQEPTYHSQEPTYHAHEQAYHAPEPSGFGEPPVQYEPHVPKPYSDEFEEHAPQKDYTEPLVDSYGAPIKTFPTGEEGFGYSQEPHDIQSFGSHSNFDGKDHYTSFSKKRPTYVTAHKQARPIPHVDDAPMDYNDDFSLKTYADVYNFGQRPKERYPEEARNPVPHYKAKPWSYGKIKPKREQKDQIIVGGQYAEPPARYVPKFQPSAPMFTEDDDNFGPPKIFDSDASGSAPISSYVNYKNSNLAFSPQNLNDAFSIID